MKEMGKLEVAQPSLQRAKMEYSWVAGGMIIAPHWQKIRLKGSGAFWVQSQGQDRSWLLFYKEYIPFRYFKEHF